jgi:hypothetical protein
MFFIKKYNYIIVKIIIIKLIKYLNILICENNMENTMTDINILKSFPFFLNDGENANITIIKKNGESINFENVIKIYIHFNGGVIIKQLSNGNQHLWEKDDNVFHDLENLIGVPYNSIIGRIEFLDTIKININEKITLHPNYSSFDSANIIAQTS